jgi:hypothetical protein
MKRTVTVLRSLARRQKFLEEANAAFAALRGVPEAWSEEQ